MRPLQEGRFTARTCSAIELRSWKRLSDREIWEVREIRTRPRNRNSWGLLEVDPEACVHQCLDDTRHDVAALILRRADHKHDVEENDQPDAKGPEKRHHRIGELRENEWRRGQAEGKYEELVLHPVPEEPEHLQRFRQKERGKRHPCDL